MSEHTPQHHHRNLNPTPDDTS
jgi:hypothetical protein